MWKNIETGREFKNRIGALWGTHLDHIKEFYKENRVLACASALMTPIVLDLYGIKLERMEPEPYK